MIATYTIPYMKQLAVNDLIQTLLVLQREVYTYNITFTVRYNIANYEIEVDAPEHFIYNRLHPVVFRDLREEYDLL